MLVPLALLSSWIASLAKASCSWPSTATWPVSGASMPIDAAHLLVALPATAWLVLLLALAPLLLLLLLLPQPAATSAVSARAARLMRTFIGAGTSSSGEFSCRQGRRPRICRGAVRV